MENAKGSGSFIHPLENGQCRIGGKIAERMDRFLFERINSGTARDSVYQEAEDAFKNQLDDESGVFGLWQGEFWGKWIIGAAQVCEYSGNEDLRNFIHDAAFRLMAYQKPDGYLGTYRDPLNVFPADTTRTKNLLGWPCNWNWNIWCRKYTLWGLLEAWNITQDPAILQAAQRLAEQLLRQLKENSVDIAQTGTFAGLPSCSILKPMVLLYKASRDDAYLDFAKELVEGWMRPDGRIPNLISNALSGKPVHEWYPNPASWAKVYEMISCFEGMLELYKIIKDKRLLEASEAFHALVKRTEMNMLFSVGFNDIFNDSASQANAISEPCDVIHWLRLSSELFSLTGKKSYLDDFEMAFYNPFLAAVYSDGKWGARGVRSQGRHLTALTQAGFTRNHCCVDNIPRGFMNMAQTAVMRAKEEVFINLYTELKADVLMDAGKIALSISGDYLSSGAVKIAVEAALRKTVLVKLRIPAWAVSSELSVDGKGVASKDAAWFEVPLSTGHAAMELHFERKLLIRNHEPQGKDTAWHKERWLSGDKDIERLYRTERACSLVYGPLLLARSKHSGNSEEEMFGPELPAGFSCQLEAVQAENALGEFKATFTSEEGTRQTSVCDYASASNEMAANEPRLFSIFF